MTVQPRTLTKEMPAAPASSPALDAPEFAVVFFSDSHKDLVPKLHHLFETDPRLQSVFSTAIFYADAETVSLRICLKPAAAKKFLSQAAVKANRLALFSPYLPFPDTNPATMTATEKLLLMRAAIDDVAFNRCKLPLASDIITMPFNAVTEQQQLFRRCMSALLVPEAEIRNYYGDEVMYYFAWFNHYNKWLCVPAAIGTALFLANTVLGLTVDTNPVVPLFSIFTMLWAVLFVKFWERRGNTLGSEFQLMVDDGAKSQRRRSYYGELRKSPVTGEEELHYPEWKRAVKQPISWFVTLLCLAGAVFLQICSLNLQGYMNSQKHELFEIPWFDQFSHPGRIFDPEGYFGTVPVVLHSLAILVLNDIYRRIASALTNWENYRTDEEFEEALTQKRVFFEFIDCFAALFYIAFYRLDLPLLRQELISLFMVDQVRRLLLESVLPFAWHTFRGKQRPQEQLPEYESFEDYLEMVMQFGYITLFASAFPLASVVALFGNMIEIRSDIFKFTYITRRPSPRRCTGIGTWTKILKGFAFLSVVSNVLLFGFTSNQMRWFFPDFFDGKKPGSVGEGDEPFIVATIFVIEHVALLLVLFLDWRIPSLPQAVEEEYQRRHYNRMKSHSSDIAARFGTNTPDPSPSVTPASSMVLPSPSLGSSFHFSSPTRQESMRKDSMATKKGASAAAAPSPKKSEQQQQSLQRKNSKKGKGRD